MKQMAASKFKAECLSVLDEVSEYGEEVVVTKRGKPVARLLPIEEPSSLLGGVKQLVDDETLSEPLGIAWHAEQ